MASIDDHPDIALETLQGMMLASGVTKLLVKELAPNDNSKNQPYVSKGNLDAVNILPAGDFEPDPEHDTLKAALDFHWLQPDGTTSNAPQTKLIFYPQYPEVRLSGFLMGAKNAPNYLMNTRLEGRLLFLGIATDRRILAWATGPDSLLAHAYAALGHLERLGVFAVVPLSREEYGVSTRDLLIRELNRIHLLDWINSKALTKDGSIIDCISSHCVGYTLEAELGVARNGISEPDFKGWEVKATTVKKLGNKPSAKAVTLMTPEPTGGLYRSLGVEGFIRRFGYPDKKGRPNRKNFGGTFFEGVRHAGTKLTLTLNGYDSTKCEIVNTSGSLALLTDKDDIAAEWSFASLMSLWNRKHAQAVYVPAERRKSPQLQYRYGGAVRIAEGTDFVRFLQAITAGSVYYDPGIKLENESSSNPRIKRRSQFRIKSRELTSLYSKIEKLNIPSH
ncbi:MAG: MvaI/BcnI family restriction endonuclease [Bradyrhizobium sp.]